MEFSFWDVFSSKGLKRYLTSILVIILSLIDQIPELAGLATVLRHLIGVTGVFGVTHSVVAGTTKSHILATIASLISIVISLQVFIPAITPYVEILTQIAAAIGALGVGTAVGEETKNREWKRSLQANHPNCPNS